MLRLGTDGLRARFRSPTSVTRRDAAIETLAEFAVGHEDGRVQRA